MRAASRYCPRFSYMAHTGQGTVECDEEFLRSYLPIRRPSSARQEKPALTMHAYFQAIEKFLTENLDKLIETATVLRGPHFSAIDAIKILAEKHGSDYHPARVLIQHGGEVIPLAVNVSVTERGHERIVSECSALAYLAETFSTRFIPQFFFYGHQSLCSEEALNSPVRMFVAEWFEGFHEFHLGANREGATVQAFLWDPQIRDTLLSRKELSEVYRQAAYILTYYYDAFSYSEIFPWHHAAGDFVVSRQADHIEVRLITVRQYAPRMVLRDNSQDCQLTALLMFLLNLTLRMRLDRDCGLGKIIWGPEQAVKDTILGFAQALRDQVDEGRMEPPFLQKLTGFLNSIPPDELTRSFLALIDSYNPMAPDVPVIKTNMEQHILSVFKVLTTLRLT